MITSAEEFKRLRQSEIMEEYIRAANDEAPEPIWQDIIDKFPDLAFWVVQNKTVPVSILVRLAKHCDPKVRGMVARKRKIPESLMLVLAQDDDESVRLALVNNGKVTETVLRVLTEDDWQTVRDRAQEKL